MLLLIDNYDSFTWNLVHYFGELGVTCEVHRNDQITVNDALATGASAIVLSPGPCTPTEAGICVDLIKQANGTVPLLGVCLGHQAIGEAYGGSVIRAPELMHGKTSTIETEKAAGLFANLPKAFDVTRYHSLVVDPDSLPKTLKVTARTQNGIIMGLQHRSHPVHGVQFHPESIASQHGHAVLANFLDLAGISHSGYRKAA